MHSKRPLMLLALFAVGCTARSPVAPVRYANRAPVWVVDDRHHVSKVPRQRKQFAMLDHLDAVIFRRVTFFLAVPEPRRARALNSLGEVPDSTWFTNRIGRHELSPSALLRGPSRLPPPDQRVPWTIHSTKVGGGSVGFIVSDASGIYYLFKFDDRGFPEVETGAHIVAQRILWACGYNVPDDQVVYLHRRDLRLAKEAKVKDVFGTKRPMTAKDLETALSKIEVAADGRIRGLASRFLSGKLLGGWPMEGRRAHDPNDLIAHELRRDVRAQRTLFAWLSQTDVKEDNTLDVLEKDPRDPKRRYVMHYLIDFGKALGTMAVQERRESGYARRDDLYWFFPTLLRFGLLVRPWEHIAPPPLRGVGLFSAKRYHPDRWESTKDYWPFFYEDRFDKFWAAKLIARFSREHLQAAVRAARYTQPATRRYLVDTLVERARLTIAPYFAGLSPFDRFSVAEGALCFDDLAVTYRFEPAATVRYAAAAYDDAARPLGELAQRAGKRPRGRVCVGPLPPSSSQQGYTIVQLAAKRGAASALPPVDVHLARGTRGTLRVIGVWRH